MRVEPDRYEVADVDNGLVARVEADGTFTVSEWQRGRRRLRMRTNSRHAVDLFVRLDVAGLPHPRLDRHELPAGYVATLGGERIVRVTWGAGCWLEAPDGYDRSVWRVAQLLPHTLDELDRGGACGLLTRDEHVARYGRHERFGHEDWLIAQGWTVPPEEFVHPAIAAAVAALPDWTQIATATRYEMRRGRDHWWVTVAGDRYELVSRHGGGFTTTALDLADRWLAAALVGGGSPPLPWNALPGGVRVDHGRVRFRWGGEDGTGTRWAESRYTAVRPLLDLVQLLGTSVEDVLTGTVLIPASERVARHGPDPGETAPEMARAVGAPVLGDIALRRLRATAGWSVDAGRDEATISSPGGPIEVVRDRTGVFTVSDPAGPFRTSSAHAVDVWLLCRLARPGAAASVRPLTEPHVHERAGETCWAWTGGDGTAAHWVTTAPEAAAVVGPWVRLVGWGAGALQAALRRGR